MTLLQKIQKPLAIAMWDTSWIRRHYRRGGFEDWDKALDELVARGYNAVRIDPHPHMVADGPGGERVEQFRCVPGRGHQTYATAMWGNPWTVTINPRTALREFIPKCEKRGIYIGLSTWFKSSEDGRFEQIEGEAGLVRVWDETLRFLQDNKLLDNIVYVDLLNEYPKSNDFVWLKKMLETMSYPAATWYNARQKQFYRGFIKNVLIRLKQRWPKFDFLVSQGSFHELDMDYEPFDLIDFHVWMIKNQEFGTDTGYTATISKHGKPGNIDVDYADVYKKLMDRWNLNKNDYIDWLDQTVGTIAGIADRWKIPCGNTEGWAAYNWTEHPALGWDWVKEAGEIGARIGAKHGYAFNCSSNFCHPHFAELWEDVAWNLKVTGIIKNGSIASVCRGI